MSKCVKCKTREAGCCGTDHCKHCVDRLKGKVREAFFARLSPRQPLHRRLSIEVHHDSVNAAIMSRRRAVSLEQKMEELFARSDEVKRFAAYQKVEKSYREKAESAERQIVHGVLQDANEQLYPRTR